MASRDGNEHTMVVSGSRQFNLPLKITQHPNLSSGFALELRDESLQAVLISLDAYKSAAVGLAFPPVWSKNEISVSFTILTERREDRRHSWRSQANKAKESRFQGEHINGLKTPHQPIYSQKTATARSARSSRMYFDFCFKPLLRRSRCLRSRPEHVGLLRTYKDGRGASICKATSHVVQTSAHSSHCTIQWIQNMKSRKKPIPEGKRRQTPQMPLPLLRLPKKRGMTKEGEG
ncbi:hypothetical protein BDZ97DRAFT_1754359 [Flammula alnicola]|nr:hypothetical protein BDZ97DRAFT_1754359 [Flammula alnicola]